MKKLKEVDSRVQYTKHVLQEALLKILEKKPIARVTVKEICETAHLNRGTFYLHYNEPNDLLKEIEDQFIEENLSHFSSYIQHGNRTDLLAGLFACILSNRSISHILMGRNGNPKFTERMKSIMRSNVVDGWCREFPGYRREDLDYIFDFIFSGATRLILNWIEDDKGLSVDGLARRLDRLGHYCQLAVKEF